MFHVDPEHLLADAQTFFAKNGCSCVFNDETAAADAENHTIRYCHAGASGMMTVIAPRWGIAHGSLQAFLDDYMARYPEAQMDYIHGDAVVTALGSKPGNIGFYLPDIEKNHLFRGVILDGVLPRKTFSMGESHEKRYYMESKRITR